jgi:transposase
LAAARNGHYPSTTKLLELQQLAAQSVGTKDLARVRGLTFEQQQLIAELALIEQHVQALDAEITQVLDTSREGRILTSIPGIGPMQAAVTIAAIGSIANFDRPAQLKAYCGLWVGAHATAVRQDAGPRQADTAWRTCAEAGAVLGSVGGDPRR